MRTYSLMLETFHAQNAGAICVELSRQWFGASRGWSGCCATCSLCRLPAKRSSSRTSARPSTIQKKHSLLHPSLVVCYKPPCDHPCAPAFGPTGRKRVRCRAPSSTGSQEWRRFDRLHVKATLPAKSPRGRWQTRVSFRVAPDNPAPG